MSFLSIGLAGCSLFGLNEIGPNVAARHVVWQLRWAEGQLSSMAPFKYGD